MVFKMWYAITANPLNLKTKEKKKEFFSREHEVIFNAETKEELENKIINTKEQYPEEFKKYLKAGIKIVEAGNVSEAKRISKKINYYFDEKGQYHIF